MPKKSVKENKNYYQLIREEQNLTRAGASEQMEFISPDRINRIEDGNLPAPDEVLAMSIAYNKPELCNYYCTHDCAIGRELYPEIKPKELSQMVLELMASVNRYQKNQESWVEMTSDNNIQQEELKQFVEIKKDLEKMYETIASLDLWVRKKIAEGTISEEEYMNLINSNR